MCKILNLTLSKLGFKPVILHGIFIILCMFQISREPMILINTFYTENTDFICILLAFRVAQHN